MITNKFILLVLVVIFVENANSLKCLGPSIKLGPCNDGLQERIKTYYVGKNQKCHKRMKVSYLRCKDPKHKGFCKCSAIGDPHYRTYDGQTIHYFGDCQYLLTKYYNKHDRCKFKVIVHNQRKGHKSKLTCTKSASIYMFGDVYTVCQGKGLKVNGVKKNVPYEKSVDVRVFVSGKLLQFVAPKCGVNVAFDGNCNLFVEVSRKYGGKMKGICGNCDGKQNDFRTKSGKDVSGHRNKYNLIGDSYAMPEKGKQCLPAPNLNLDHICPGEWKRKIVELTQCGSLISKGSPFQHCAVSGKIKMKDIFDDCKIDVCSNRDNVRRREKARCKILEAVAEICAEAGFPGITWRTRLNCPLKCRENQHFSAKVTPCPRTCENHFYGSKNPCYHLPEREACECNSGYIRDGALCVKPWQCTCIDVCSDRATVKHCKQWTKEGMCKKFPAQMKSMCKKSCGFCRPKSNDCRNELSTWKCVKFRDAGKCVYDFYKAICGLTCNYNKCGCAKDKQVIGRCDMVERRQTITYYHYVRNKRGKCVCRITQRTRVCACPFIYRTTHSKCNYCTGKIRVTIFSQKEQFGKCIRRTSHSFIQCSNCPANRKHYSVCLHNNLIVKTTEFNQRIKCDQCIPKKVSVSHSVKCTNSVITGKCNPRNCIQTITYVNRKSIRCKCVEQRHSKSLLCCCIKKYQDVPPFCQNGKIIHRRIEYRFSKGVCRPHFKDRITTPGCRRPKDVRGKCVRYRQKQLYCIAADSYYSVYVNKHCKCVVKRTKDFRRCCCRGPQTYKKCNNLTGVIETVTITYTLERKQKRFHCKKHVKRTRKIIHCITQYIRKKGKCQRNCFRTDSIYKRYRHGCIIKTVFNRVETILCCCLPAQFTRTSCVSNFIIFVELYRKMLVGVQCRDILVSRNKRIVNCPPSKITRGPCIYPGHQRLVTVSSYSPLKCRCVMKQKKYKEQCRPCPYKVTKVHTTPCNKKTCLETVYTYFQDVDCKYKVKRCDQLCCCKDLPWKRKYCDGLTGLLYTINYWYDFNSATKTCSEKSTKVSTSVACILIVKIHTGKCGQVKKYYKKRTLTRYVLNKKTCSCKPVQTVTWIICACDTIKYSKWNCLGTYLARVGTTYHINWRENRCDRRTHRELRLIRCPRPRPSQTVIINRCKYLIRQFFYRIINCKCQLKTTETIYFKCCLERSKITTKCIRENTIQTTKTTYIVAANKRRCIAVVTVLSRVIRCKIYVKKWRTKCIKGKYFVVTEYYGVVNCRCVKIREHRQPVICECFPKTPVIKRVCLRIKWVTTITTLKLHLGRCLPRTTSTEAFIRCALPVATRGPCDRKTGWITVRSVYYDIIQCKCIRRIKYYKIRCPCWKRDRIVRPLCVSNVRVVRRERYQEVNGRCKWVVIETEIEDCKCKARKSITVCFKNVIFRTTITYYVSVLVNLKIPVRKCRKRISETFKPFGCNKKYTYVTPCKNYRQSVITCSYSKVNCKCREHCRLDCFRACNCRHMNYCRTQCIKNIKYQICHRFNDRGVGCVSNANRCIEHVTKKIIPLNCSPPFVSIICSPCNIHQHNGYYKKCKRFFVVKENCQCKIKETVSIELCRCKPKWVSKPHCQNNHLVTITTYYVIINGKCVLKTTKSVKAIYCPRSYFTVRKLRCVIEYKLTYYVKRNCQCIKKYIIKNNKTCCPKMSITTHCKKHQWVYVQRTYDLQYSKIQLFPGKLKSPALTYCRCVIKQWTKDVRCPRNYVIKCCNVVTRQLRIDSHVYRLINCACVKKVTTTYESCGKCKKRTVVKSKCYKSDRHGLGYRDVTVTYYKITKQNICKKFVKHHREICRCPKSYSKSYCKSGQMVTETVTYHLLSRPACVKHVSMTSKSKFCYNNGRPNPWILVKIKKCRKPGQYTIAVYMRYVFNKVTCGCHKVFKQVKINICCKPCYTIRKCIRNLMVYTKVCEHSKHLKCVVYKKSWSVKILCPAPIKKLIGDCIRGYQKYSLKTYSNVNCKCVRKIVYRQERCKCFPTRTKICDNNRMKITTTDYRLSHGQCIPKIKISYENIFCIKIVTFKDFPIDKCNFWRHTYNKIGKNCKCVDHFLSKEKLHYCCKPGRTEVKCKDHQIIVKIVHYFLLIQFRCLPRTRFTKYRVNCNKLIPVEKVKLGQCRVKFIYYKAVHQNCRCHRKKIREIEKETCCHHKKPYTKTVCEKKKGLIITYYYSYYLGPDGHCHVQVKTTTVGAYCNRKDCHTSVGECIKHTRVVKIYCKRRIHCRCVMKLVYQGYQCCKRENFHWKVVGPCIGYFKTITYFAYRLDKKLNRCRAVAIRIQKRRCRCPKGYVKYECVKDVYKHKIVVSYTLNTIRDSCIETKDRSVTVISGCTTKERLLGIVNRKCNKVTGRGTVTYEYIYAKNCECKTIRRVKPIICNCDTAYPQRVRTYCKRDRITVKETITATCNGDIVEYTTTTQETPIHCDRVVVEVSECFPEKRGHAERVRYVSKIEYKLRNCKCYRRVIEKRKEDCKCIKSWTTVKCDSRRNVIIIHTNTIRIQRGICNKSVKQQIKNVPCPIRPQVTRTLCRNNRYQVITKTFYLQNCKCLSRVSVKHCDCKCPAKQVTQRCTRNYVIEIKTVWWTMVACRCIRQVNILERIPICPRFIRETVGPCIRKGDSGYKTITTRSIQKIPYICKCKIVSVTRSQICWCSEKLIYKKYCHRNNIWIQEIWKLFMDVKGNHCVLRKVSSSSRKVTPPATIVTYKCNKVTGKETITTISYTIRNCRTVKHVNVKIYRCICTKEWKLIKRGKCSRAPLCIRTDVYVRQELRNKQCINIKENKKVRCCCHPSQKVIKYCQKNRMYTKVITYTLKQHICYASEKVTWSGTVCLLVIVTKETKCNRRGLKIIRQFAYAARNCKCVLVKINEKFCRCRCNKSHVKYHCDRQNRIRTKIITTYSIVNCQCVTKVQKVQVFIRCRPNQTIVSKCLRVKGGNHYEIMTVKITFHVNTQCICVQRKTVSVKICKCIRNERKTKTCDRKTHVITEKTIFTILLFNKCVTKIRIRKHAMNCKPRWWVLKSDSGCIVNRIYGERILTYVIKVPVNCQCIEKTKVVKCNCRCTGRSRRSQCFGNKIKHTHYTYSMIKCKCVRKESIKWEYIVCRDLRPLKEKCREVSKHVYMEYTIYRKRFVLNCRCMTRIVRVGRICRCRDGYTVTVCNRNTNKLLHTRYWFVFMTNLCKKQSETLTKIMPCDLTPDCHVISRCKEDSQTQRYECIERYRENCKCHQRGTNYVQRCECKPKRVICGRCNKRTCYRNMTTITYHLIVLKNNKKKCVESKKVRRERCCCNIKPVKTVECIRNKVIIKITSYHFNKISKVCDKISSVTDKTPVCRPAHEQHLARCNLRTCLQNINIITRILRNCVCIVTKSTKTRECCCKQKDYSIRDCICGNIIQTTIYTYKFVRGRCVMSTSEKYERAKCPADRVRYGPCRKRLLTQVKEVTTYDLRSCNCIPRVLLSEVVCACPPPNTKVLCLEKTGVIQTTFTYYVFNRFLHKCFVYQRLSIVQINCRTKPITVYKACRVIYKLGVYRACTTTSEVRIGCKCFRKSLFHFKLCLCPKPYQYVVCEKNKKVRKEVYYVKVLSNDKNRDFVCVKRIKIISTMVIDCMKPTVSHGPCINHIRIYTLKYYQLINCVCVPRIKTYKVVCRCNKPHVISERCVDDVRKERRVRYYRLICDKKHIPTCRCVHMDRVESVNTICKKPQFKVCKCKGDKKEITSIHYEPRNCKCHQIKYKTTIRCTDTCYDMPHCSKIKKLGLCRQAIFYQFECQITCGYCEKCPEDHIVKYVGKCKCRTYDGLTICTKKTLVKHYRVINRRCTNTTVVYRSICNCLDTDGSRLCYQRKLKGQCKDKAVMKRCEKTCNPNCNVPCHGKIQRRHCVQRGARKGTYKTVLIHFVPLGDVCLLQTKVSYHGHCLVCSRSVRQEVTACIGNVRYKLTYYVIKVNGVCINKVKRTPFSCKDCCPSTETLIGDCIRNRRSVITVFWANINNCCKKQTITNIYSCNPRCAGVSLISSRCVLNKRMEFKIWKSGKNCASHASYSVVSCVPVPV